MSIIGHVSDEEFVADFPLDFGRGIRGEYVASRGKTAGIVICHRMAGDIGCACSAFWVKVDEQPIYTRSSPLSEPLTIEEDIRCSCGLHGWIKEGKWEHAHDSLL